MSSVSNSGTQAATVGTEHTLAQPTAAGTYVLLVDTQNLVNADILELRLKRKVLSGGTVRECYYAAYRDQQSQPVKVSLPLPTPHGVDATLKQTAGTGRSFDWSLETV